jgi:copper oxidase (laccase) domain-containing protein
MFCCRAAADHQKPIGYLAATVTIIFLPLLMTALTAKVIAMAHAG